MKGAISYFIKKASDWAFRKRSPALFIVRLGFILMSSSLVGSWAMFIKYSDSEHFFEVSYHSSNVGSFILLTSFTVGALAFICGVIWEYKRYVDEAKIKTRKKVIVIEQRGLVDTSDDPLNDFIENELNVITDPLITDIRERIIDNVVTHPELALLKINHLKLDLMSKKERVTASDISVAYGGIMPVPFSFYTGYLLDDESKVSVYDWCRDESTWKLLDEDDDGESFVVENKVRSGKEAVLAISFSYLVDKSCIESEFNDKSVHYLSLKDRHRNNHWSLTKQNRLAGEFFEYCKYLLEQGAEHIHLVLASQNSVAFRFGQSYDKRNLPPLTLYQYEKHSIPKYPWGLNISQVSGKEASIQFQDSERKI